MNENHRHDHNHDHSKGHAHVPTNFSKAFALGISLNIAYVIVEAVFGVLSNSVALLADAGHNLSDVLGLVDCMFGARSPEADATARYTYGLRGQLHPGRVLQRGVPAGRGRRHRAGKRVTFVRPEPVAA